MYSGKHQRNRRTMAENADYCGKHESLAAIFAEVAEIVAEMTEALALTDEYIAEITAPARKLAEKLTERIRARINRVFPAPVWKMRSGIFPGKVVVPYAGIV